MIAADISFWTFLWYAFAGLVIGVLAKLLMPGKQNMNIIATILLGVVSAIIGAFLWNAIFVDQEGVAWIGGVVVAVVLPGSIRGSHRRRSRANDAAFVASRCRSFTRH